MRIVAAARAAGIPIPKLLRVTLGELGAVAQRTAVRGPNRASPVVATTRRRSAATSHPHRAVDGLADV
jgi:hypothetical protein